MPTPNTVRVRIYLWALLVLASAALAAAVEGPRPEPQFKARHAPKQPKTGEQVVITVEAPASVKADDLALEYQIVEPGKYIDLQDPA